jgi:hypothetical protein
LIHRKHVPLPKECEDHLQFFDHVLPIEFVEVEPDPEALKLPGDMDPDATILIHSIHGGDVIMPDCRMALNEFYPNRDPERIDDDLLKAYAREKDWGANQVCAALARKLGMQGYWRVNTARVLMDFGRFPGITPPGADHLNRFAINYPFSYALDHQGKQRVLESTYDAISAAYERANEGKILKLGIHSYDPYNPGHTGFGNALEFGTPRPEMSVLYRSKSIQEHTRMPFGLFDRLYPDQLGEYTADRKLAARLSLTLEKAGISVSPNYPYLLPDGSVEVRSQVWFFFKYLRREFSQNHPETEFLRSYSMVWDMLLDTNLRSSESDTLRSFLHMFRRPPQGMEDLYIESRKAYGHICQYVHDRGQGLVEQFRLSDFRMSTLGIEVRKDLIWKFKDKFARRPVMGPEGCRHDNVECVAELLAQGFVTYFAHDRGLYHGEMYGKGRKLRTRQMVRQTHLS